MYIFLMAEPKLGKMQDFQWRNLTKSKSKAI
jgi:hypothetical protein